MNEESGEEDELSLKREDIERKWTWTRFRKNMKKRKNFKKKTFTKKMNSGLIKEIEMSQSMKKRKTKE